MVGILLLVMKGGMRIEVGTAPVHSPQKLRGPLPSNKITLLVKILVEAGRVAPGRGRAPIRRGVFLHGQNLG